MTRLVQTSLTLGLFLGCQSHAQQVPLQNATATASFVVGDGRYIPGQAIDGITSGDQGWSPKATATVGPSATFVCQTTTNIGFQGGTYLFFTLYQGDGLPAFPNEQLGRFRLSVTTDDRGSYADGLGNGGNVTANWTVLTPLAYSAANGATLTLQNDNSLLASGGADPTVDTTYTIQAFTTLKNITGFRLEALTDPSLPDNGPGRSAIGNFELQEFKVSVAQNLVQDGNFESPSVNGNHVYLSSGDNFGGAWQVESTTTTFDVYANSDSSAPIYWHPTPDGTQFAYLADNVGISALRQDLATPLTNGIPYLLSFLQSGFIVDRGFPAEVTASIADTASQNIVWTKTFVVGNGDDWTKQAATFTVPADGPYTLRLTSSEGKVANVDGVKLGAVNGILLPQSTPHPRISAIGLLDLRTSPASTKAAEGGVTHLCLDGQNNLFAGGYFRGCLAYSPLKLANTNQTVVAFASRVNDSANPIWLKNSSACLTPALMVPNPNGGAAFFSYFHGPITNTFAGCSVVSTSDWGGLILELDSNGSVTKHFLLEADGTNNLPHVTTEGNEAGVPFAFISAHFDRGGNLYVGGNYVGAVRVGGIPLSSSYGTNDQDYFIAKFGSDGATQWALEGGSPANDEIFDMAVDTNGNSFVVGGFGGTNSLGDGTLAAPIFDGDGFAWKLDPGGNVLWGQRASAVVPGYSRDFHGVLPDGAGGCFVAGAVSSEVDTNGSTPTTFNAFVARLNSFGGVAWSAQLIATNGTINAELGGIDTSGNIYLAGDFDHAVSFGRQFNLSPSNSEDNVFVAGLTPDGNFAWANEFGAQAISDFQVDVLGNCFVLGTFNSTIIGTDHFTARGSPDTFLAKLGSGGSYDWAVQIGGIPANWAGNITPDNTGGVYFAGSFSGINYIEDTSLAGSGVLQSFVARIVDTLGTNVPTVVIQPRQQRIVGPTNLSLQVTAIGQPPLSYQWTRNNTNLIGATGSVLNLNLLKRADGGVFSVTVSNAAGFSASSNAAVRVMIPELLKPPSRSATGSQIYFGDSDGSPMNLDDLTNFVVQTSPDLVSTSWTSSTNVLSLTNGFILFNDASPVNSNRFYRVLEQ